jgi:hypothetical protein
MIFTIEAIMKQSHIAQKFSHNAQNGVSGIGCRSFLNDDTGLANAIIAAQNIQITSALIGMATFKQSLLKSACVLKVFCINYS